MYDHQFKPHPDPEMRKLEEALMRGLDEVSRGVAAAVHTPEMIAQEATARRARGRPVGSIKPNPKKPVQIRFDPDVLEALRATGKGWQTRVNDAMREWLNAQQVSQASPRSPV
jgi:uncharacterized protein (DUF4415 family)